MRSGALSFDEYLYSPLWAYGTPSAGDPNQTLPYVTVVNTEDDSHYRLHWYPNRTGPQYSRPNWRIENHEFSGPYERYWGAVDGGNGKIYGIPYGAERVLIIDTLVDSIFQSAEVVSGGADPLTQTDFGKNPVFHKFSGGTRSSYNDMIYCFPRLGKTILKINTNNDSITEIALPSPIDTFSSKSFGCVEGSDGKIYSVPWQFQLDQFGNKKVHMFVLDPRDDSIEVIDLSDLINEENLGQENLFYAYGASHRNKIYFAPFWASKMLVIDLIE